MGRHRTIIVLSIAVMVAIVALPAPAHAGFFDTLGYTTSSLAALMLDVGSEALDTLSKLLIRAVAFMGRSLQDIISFQPTYGGATVYQLWKWLRDLCNMLFVVVLVAIAFGTIFDTIKPTGFHARQSLALFVVAAILINLSLAVGQTIVWTGNQATEIVLDFMPKNVGAQLATSLNTIELATGTAGTITQPPPAESTGTTLDQLDPSQRDVAQSWLDIGSGERPANPEAVAAAQAALVQLQNCLSANQMTVEQCWQLAQNQHRATYQGVMNQTIQAETENSAFLRVSTILSNAVYGTDTVGLSYGESTDLGKSLSRFSGLLVRLFLLLVLVLSFLVIILFMIARIPAIWFMLALSAVPFFALAVPPARQQFSSWLKNIVGISFFGPMYLMVIYLGLFVLSTQGSLIASGNNINDLPFISSIFGAVFFYIIAAFIFVAGAGMVTKIAFGLSPAAGSIFGAIGGKLGVSPATGFGIRTIARGAGAVTGAPTIARGLRRGAEERYKRVVGRPLTQRRERLEAGVRTLVEGGKARQEYLQGRIKDRTDRLDKQIQKQTDRAARRLEQAQAAIVQAEARVNEASGKGFRALEQANRVLDQATARRAKAEQGVEQLKNKQEEKLRGMLQEAQAGRLTASNETAVAAGNQLMKMQKITAEELANLQQRHAQISPVALQGFVKQRNEQLQKDAKTRKYTNSDEIKQFLQFITDKKEAGKFIDAAKTGKNKFPAIIAGAELKLIVGADGKTPVSVEEAVKREARKFNATDMLKAEQYYHERGPKRPEEVEDRFINLVRRADSYAEMLANASADQLTRITEAKDSAARELLDLEKKIRDRRSRVQRGERAKQDVSADRLKLDQLQQRKRDLTRGERERVVQPQPGGEPKKPEEPKPEPKP